MIATPSQTEVLGTLRTLGERLYRSEQAVVHATNTLFIAKSALLNEEARLLLDERVEGKNAETRAAHLRMLTIEARSEVDLAESHLRQVVADRAVLLEQSKLTRSIAYLLGGREE